MRCTAIRAFALSGFAFAVMLAGCSREGEGEGRNRVHLTEMGGGGRASAPLTMSMAKADAPRDSKLAYEHTVSIEIGKQLLSARLQELQAACGTDEKFGCKILDVSSSDRDEVPNGGIRMRLAPAGVDVFVDMAAKDARIAERTTHAEDLAEPVADTERNIAQLTAHRERLDAFLKNKELKIEQVIAVSKELASVQMQLDEIKTRHANLLRRIDTELLYINLSLPPQDYRSEQHPIRDAVRSFGNDFLRAIAQVIGFIAGLLPWLVVIVPGIVLLRLFWNRLSRWLARRDQRAT